MHNGERALHEELQIGDAVLKHEYSKEKLTKFCYLLHFRQGYAYPKEGIS